MAIVTYSRAASKDEMAREIDRRGNVIEALEAEVARLKDQIYESIPKWQVNDLQQKLDAAEARVKALEAVVSAAEDLAKDYAWARGKLHPDLDDDSQWTIYAPEHPVMRFRAARAAIAKAEGR